MKKSFEDYLYEVFFSDIVRRSLKKSDVLDKHKEASFSEWLSYLSVRKVIQYAEEWRKE